MNYGLSYNKVIYEQDGYVGLNVSSKQENAQALKVYLEFKGAKVSEEFMLAPGASVGNVKCSLSEDGTSKMCKLVCVFNEGNTTKFDVLVSPKQ